MTTSPQSPPEGTIARIAPVVALMLVLAFLIALVAVLLPHNRTKKAPYNGLNATVLAALPNRATMAHPPTWLAADKSGEWR